MKLIRIRRLEFAAIRSVLVSDRILAFLAQYSLALYLLVSGSALTDRLVRSRGWQMPLAVLGALYLSTHTLELVRPWLVR